MHSDGCVFPFFLFLTILLSPNHLYLPLIPCTDYFTVSILLPFPKCILGIIQYIDFSDCNVSLNNMYLTFLHVTLWLNSSFPFVCMPSPFSHVCFFATLYTVAHQAPLSMGFSKQEYWSGLPFPSPGDLPDPGMEPTSLMSPALAGGFFTTTAPWKTSFPLVPKSILFSGCTTVYPFTHWRTSWLTPDLEIMNKAAINMHLQDFV